MDSLKQYVENEIIPRYAAFDAAHREDHARTVIEQCGKLAEHYDVNPKMLYVAAACHDLGLAEGREFHHLASGRIIREDRRLREWFSEDEIETIAQAAEDHRASGKNPPRSIYGRIVAEADRIIVPETVTRRAVQFGFSHYPEMSRRQMWERTLSHLKEKYGEGGYLKLWIPESDNAARLAELRKLISDSDRLRSLFDAAYREEKFAPAVCRRFLEDERYRNGHIRIVAAAPGTLILGLHTPEMKAFAKENAVRPEWRDDLKFIAESAAVSPLSHDERIIWGLTVDYVKCGIEERLEYLDALIPYIDNWAICDTLCCNARWASKPADRPAVWKYVRRKLKSRKEFTRRVGIVLMLGHFLDDAYFGRCLEALAAMNLKEGEPYYVRMGVAWLLATALAKFPEATRDFVSSASFPEDILSLYVRKARESFRTRNVPALNAPLRH